MRRIKLSMGMKRWMLKLEGEALVAAVAAVSPLVAVRLAMRGFLSREEFELRKDPVTCDNDAGFSFVRFDGLCANGKQNRRLQNAMQSSLPCTLLPNLHRFQSKMNERIYVHLDRTYFLL